MPNEPMNTAPQPLGGPTGLTPIKPKMRRRTKVFIAIGGVLAAALLTLGGVFLWYMAQLTPVHANADEKVLVTIKSGSAPQQIADQLVESKVVKNSTAFMWYTRLTGVQNKLQAGTYRLSGAESTQEIVDHLVKGMTDMFRITFLPGNTLAKNKEVFLAAGYSETEVDAAFAKTYVSPLFASKPPTADLEGYIYGETYSFAANTSVEAILEHIFEYYYEVIQTNGLEAKFQAQGLNLYQGITLASIVQREASPAATDMPQIAQVFLLRLATGMPLGSDVTYQYIADKTGVARDPNLDSPYNTRRYAGLPPGPIAAPGEKALKAVGSPASGDYLFFLSGDDDVTYFARTNAEHEANIQNHCQEKCKIL